MNQSENPYSWIIDTCLASDEVAPARLVEALMADERCVAFGPIHHFLVGAALLTCLRNVQGSAAREGLVDNLAELAERAVQVPGAACARWGICGAAISAGMAFAIASGNEPLKAAGWSEGQRMVANMGLVIADAGAPRCCKRDARIVAAMAVPAFSEAFGVQLAEWPVDQPCAVASKNKACLATDCPYFG